MKMLNRIAAFLLLGMAAATAADLPTKAPAASPAGCTITYCVGAYVGADLSGVATNVNVFGNGLSGSLNAGGTILGVHAGYRAWNGTIYLAGEVGCGADVSGGTTGIGSSFSNRWDCMELVKIGGSISSLLGSTPITFPQALQPYLMSLYGITGGKQRMGSTGIVGGAGAEFVIAPKATINLEYLNVSYSGAGATDVPGIAATDENLFRLSFNRAF